MAIHVQMEVPTDRGEIEAAVEGLTRLNERLMRDTPQGVGGGPSFPDLYQSGVRYRREPPGQEDWQHAGRLLAGREGDCEDLAAYQAAWYRVNLGEPASVHVIVTGRGTFHAIIQRGDGTLEDPSRILITMEARSMKQKPKICLRDTGSHHLATMTLPMGGGQELHAAELGFDAFGALSKLVGTVWDVVSSPAVSAMLPPQAAIAIQATKMITDMSPEGLKKLLKDARTTDAQRKLAAAVLDAKLDKSDKGDVQPTGQHPSDWTPEAMAKAGLGFDFFNPLTYVAPFTVLPLSLIPSGSSGSSARPTRTVVVGPSSTPASAPSGGAVIRDHRTGQMVPVATTPIAPAPPRQGVPPGTTQYPAQPAPTPPIDPATGQPVAIDPATGQPMWGYPPAMPSPYGYPPAMPSPYGYPPMPSPYGYPPMPSPYGYPPAMPSPYGYPPMPYPMPQAPGVVVPEEPLTVEEAAAVQLWGSGSFATGAFPGYPGSDPAAGVWPQYPYGGW